MSDEHLDMLRNIWGELKTVNSRVNETNGAVAKLGVELAKTNARLEDFAQQTNERFARLEQVQVESEIRLATEIVAVVGAIHEVRDTIREDRVERQRIDKLERRVDALERKRRN